MGLNDDELEDRLEMLPTHSTTRRPNTHTTFIRLGRRLAARYGVPLLLGIAGMTVFGYLFWPGGFAPHRPRPRPPPIGPDIDDIVDIHPPSPNLIWLERGASVKEAFVHAYGGYEKYTTFPDDELRPISNSGQRKCVYLLSSLLLPY
jgi:hypothetical protein